jgi:hypothetical protein
MQLAEITLIGSHWAVRLTCSQHDAFDSLLLRFILLSGSFNLYI